MAQDRCISRIAFGFAILGLPPNVLSAELREEISHSVRETYKLFFQNLKGMGHA